MKFIFLIATLLLISGCVSYEIEDLGKYNKDGIQYGIIKGNFLGRWWDFYHRGRSFADGKFYPEAERDLRQALALRKKDQRRSRTYGLHFVRYFGNRELGVVLYEQGTIKEAIGYLKRSLEQDPTEKAEFYLNRCLQKLSLLQEDSERPNIKLDPTPALTNSKTLVLSGNVSDNLFVDTLTVNELEISPILKKNLLPFQEKISLYPGLNSIRLVAIDTSGNQTSISRDVQLDLDPPVISILKASQNKLVLAVNDESGIRLVQSRLENIELQKRPKETVFEFKKLYEGKAIYAEFEDEAKNRNGIRIKHQSLQFGAIPPLSNSNSYQRIRFFPKFYNPTGSALQPSYEFTDTLPTTGVDTASTLRWGGTSFYAPKINRNGLFNGSSQSSAFFRRDPACPVLLASSELPYGIQLGSSEKKHIGTLQQTENPQSILEVEQLEGLDVVYQDSLVISGRIQGPFTGFRINGKVKIEKGNNVRFCFTEFLELEKINPIELELQSLTDKNAVRISKSYSVKRLPRPLEENRLRAGIVLFPILNEGSGRSDPNDSYESLVHEVYRSGRFRILPQKREVIYQIAKERKLIRDGWIHQSKAAELGKKLQSDYVISCAIRPTFYDLEIFGRLIDSSSGKVLAKCDVYELGQNATDSKNTYKRFATKLKQNFPIVETKVEPVMKARKGFFNSLFTSKSSLGPLTIALGENANIKEGMKFIAYHLGDPLTDSETGQIIVEGKISIDGRLTAQSVKSRSTRLNPIQSMTSKSTEFVVSQ